MEASYVPHTRLLSSPPKTSALVHTVEYYPAGKMNKIVPCAETWVDLESVIQSDKSEKQVSYINA